MEQLASRFDISIDTLYKWMKRHSEFAEAVSSGKDEADDKVAEGMYAIAIGYSHPETKYFVIDGEVVEQQTTKHYEPSFAAQRFWLMNRKSKFWKEKSDVTVHRGTDEMTDEEIERAIREEEARATNETGPAKSASTKTESET